MTEPTFTQDLYVQAQEVRIGDLINGIPVMRSERKSDHPRSILWYIEAGENDTWEGTTEAYVNDLRPLPKVSMILPRDHPVAVRRTEPLEPGQCQACGRKNMVKYKKLHVCGACYAKAQRVSTGEKDPGVP